MAFALFFCPCAREFAIQNQIMPMSGGQAEAWGEGGGAGDLGKN